MSVWQKGPDFLSLPQGSWPVNRKFISDVKIPREETKSANDFLRVAVLKSMIDNDKRQFPLFDTVQDILSKGNNIESRKRVLARIIKGWGSKSLEIREKKVSENLCRDDLIKAERLILLASMPNTVDALQKGQLDSLLPY